MTLHGIPMVTCFSIIYWWSINPERLGSFTDKAETRGPEGQNAYNLNTGVTTTETTVLPRSLSHNVTPQNSLEHLKGQLSVTNQWSYMCWQSKHSWLQYLVQELLSPKTLGPEKQRWHSTLALWDRLLLYNPSALASSARISGMSLYSRGSQCS